MLICSVICRGICRGACAATSTATCGARLRVPGLAAVTSLQVAVARGEDQFASHRFSSCHLRDLRHLRLVLSGRAWDTIRGESRGQSLGAPASDSARDSPRFRGHVPALGESAPSAVERVGVPGDLAASLALSAPLPSARVRLRQAARLHLYKLRPLTGRHARPVDSGMAGVRMYSGKVKRGAPPFQSGSI